MGDSEGPRRQGQFETLRRRHRGRADEVERVLGLKLALERA